MKALEYKTFASALVAGVLVLGGCAAKDDPSESNGDTDAGSTGGDSMSSTASMSTTDQSTTSDSSTTTAGTTMSTSTTDASGSSSGITPQPNGADCSVNAECESGFCFFVSILGGVCGECLTEDDCADGGCTPPNPLIDPPIPAMCNTGQLGEGCNTDAVCVDGNTCIEIIDIPNIITISTCGECNNDGECTDGELCAPQFDVLNFTGQKECVPPDSVAAGGGCDHLGSGDEQCMGDLICADIDIMGLITVGICGECEVDADCDTNAGEVCNPADVDLDTGMVTPPTCGPAA